MCCYTELTNTAEHSKNYHGRMESESVLEEKQLKMLISLPHKGLDILNICR